MKAMQANRREIACAGKVPFSSFARASKVASKQAHKRSQKMNVYACAACGKFHVGSAIGGSKQRGGAIDPRKPYLVYARDRTGKVCVIGRSDAADGGKLKDVLALDGWEIVKVARIK